MKFRDDDHSWKWMDAFRGRAFHGEWPTLHELIDIEDERFGDNKCFIAYAPAYECFTYREACAKIRSFAGWLLDQGLKKGDKVAVTGHNSPEWAIAFFGIIYAGLTVVPLDCQMHDADMEKLLSFSDVSYFCSEKERLDSLDRENRLHLFRISLDRDAEGYPFLFDLGSDTRVADPPALEDTAAILFTSGTTGTPKGVMLTHKNFVSDNYIAQSQMDVGPDDVFYALLPIHHAYTMLAVLMESFSVGASTVFARRLVISQIFKEIREAHVTMFLGVPMLFNKLARGLMSGLRKKGGPVVYVCVRFLMEVSGLLKKITGKNIGKKWFLFLTRQISLDSVRICISGGGPLPKSTFRIFNQLGLDFVQGYGLTETTPIVTLNPTYAFKLSSVGRYFPLEEVKIVDPDASGNGVICVKGPNVMKGYYKNPEATREVLSEDGWLDTGDVGHLDKQKYLYLTGRKRNIIVTEGGKNVFPEEIEDLFQLYDDIDTICVLGYTANRKDESERVRAIIYPSKEYAEAVKKAHPDDWQEAAQKHMEQIVAAVNRTLLSYKRITRVTLTWEPLPKSGTLKVKRYLVKEKFAE